MKLASNFLKFSIAFTSLGCVLGAQVEALAQDAPPDATPTTVTDSSTSTPPKPKKKKKVIKADQSATTTEPRAAHPTTGSTEMKPNAESPNAATATPTGTTPTPAATDATAAPVAKTESSEETKNNRQKTLEGSKSRFSGQAQLGYSASVLSTAFSGELPNPGHDNPPPMVSLSGTVGIRYRLDKKTTVGVNTGLILYKPFTNPNGFSVSDPTVDIAHSYKLGPISNRTDLFLGLYTDNQYASELGYLIGFTAEDDVYWVYKRLTLGVTLMVDINSFKSGAQYQPLLGYRDVWDFVVDPFVEFSLTKWLNVRSLLGMTWQRNQDQNTFFPSGPHDHPRPYQTLGLGFQVAEPVFLYAFVRFFPFANNMAWNTTFWGVSSIINLF